MDDDDDAALFAAMTRGDDHGSLEVLYDRHAPILLTLAVHIVGDRARAEDLLHDIFLDLVKFSRRSGASCQHVLRWLVLCLFERVG